MSGYTKEDKHAHDTFRKDAIKSIKEGQLQKAARSYEACAAHLGHTSAAFTTFSATARPLHADSN